MNSFFPLQHGPDKIQHSRREALDVAPDAIDLHAGETRSSETTINNKHLFRAGVVITMCLAVFLGKAFYLQVFQGDHYREIAENNRLRTEITPAVRGVIYDNEGVQLVHNSPAFTLVVTPSELPDDKNERAYILEKTHELTGVSPTTIDLTIANQPDAYYEAIPIDTPLEYENALSIYLEENDLPGISVELLTVRQYEQTPLKSISHVLGYTGFISPEEYAEKRTEGYRRTDKLGKQGIESTHEELLRGVSGTRSSEVDALGREVLLIRKQESIPGANINLALDYELTTIIETRLESYMKTYGQHKASVVVLDPRDGGIRALVSIPGYNGNSFAKGISQTEYDELLEDPFDPLFPRATSGEFPPGSTIKPVVAAIALEDGLINQSSSFLSTGGVRISEWFFPDWKAGGHGVTDVRKAIAESVNTFFYIIGGGLGDIQGLGIEKITKEAQRFGLGSETGIDLPQEADGFLPSKSWKQEVKEERWYIGDTYHAAIGQGDVLVTPIQTAVMTSVFANGGSLFEPHIIDSFEKDGETVDFEPVIRSEQVMNKEHLQVVREGMRQAVKSGSAQYLQTLPEAVAGKTGTAQAGGDRQNHSWFTSFGPYNDPEIVVTVLVEEAGEGSAVAAPIARDIYAWWFANR